MLELRKICLRLPPWLFDVFSEWEKRAARFTLEAPKPMASPNSVAHGNAQVFWLTCPGSRVYWDRLAWVCEVRARITFHMAFQKPNLTNLNGHGLSLCHLTLVVVHAGDSVSRQIDHIDIRTNNRKTPGLAVNVTQEPDLAGISDKTTPSADSSAGIFLAMLNGSDVVFLDGVSQKKV